jgi:predicted phosphoadenosine phosphosulfate sulfurtransferase
VKIRVVRRRMSVLEFERTFAKRGVFIYKSDRSETFNIFGSYANLLVSTMPNTIDFYNGDWEEWVTFYQVKYVDVLWFAGADRVYCTIVCNGWSGDVKHRIIFAKNN